MAEPEADTITRDRMIFLAIGALAGAAAYVLIDILPDRIDDDHLFLLIVTATGGFFAAFLASFGPLSFARAAAAAALAGGPAAVLLYLASRGFDDVDTFLETGHPIVAYAVMVGITLPFLIAAQRAGEGWRHYPALFTQSWNIVVRYAAAWIFTGLFWGVVFLSDALFGLVGLDIIEDLLDIDWVPYVLTGAVLGLAMAVVVELSDYVSPFLILRLLRLLLPVLLVVTLVFLVALPLQGLSDLFGGLSAAATLMGIALGIATLITSALARTDEDAVTGMVMRLSAQVLALAMPVLAGLAIYAIWLRVADYGWSPNRLAAAVAAGVVMGYAVLYALSVVLRTGWMGRIRAANIVMALLAVAVSALWLSPLFDPQAISAGDQVTRFERGDVSADKLDLWFIRHELGRAGAPAIAQLAAMDHPEAEALAARLERLETANSRYGFENRAQPADIPDLIARVRDKVVVLPEGRTVMDSAFSDMTPPELRRVIDGCERTTPGGNAGCVLLLADFIAARDGDEALLFYATSAGNAVIRVLHPASELAHYSEPVFLAGNRTLNIGTETIDALLEGAFELGPTEVMSLSVGAARIIVKP